MAVYQPNTEPLPGYRLLEPLGKGGFGEVWKCEVPGGLVKAIKFVAGQTQDLGDNRNGAAQELRALQHIKSIRHPFLLSMDRVEIVDGDLLIVMELADRSLQDLLNEYRQKGQPGIPRDELLRYLEEAAEVLDLMNQEHHLQHLDIKPGNLFLVGRHVKVADFGLVNSAADLTRGEASPLQLDAVTPTYAAPESFVGKISTSSDQYSLAVAYHEMLTGTLPFTGKNFRQLALQHMQTVPNLSALPESDRPAVARALAKEPKERFASCGAFVQALIQGKSDTTEMRIPARTFSTAQAPLPPSAHDSKFGESSTPTEAAMETRPVVPPSSTALPSVGPSASLTEFAGLRLLECVSRQPGSDLWRGLTKDGQKRLVRFLSGVDAKGAGDDPFVQMAQFKHVGLAKRELVRDGPNRVGLVTDAGDDHLGVRLKECLEANLPGIPRQELLDHLASVAAALDDLFDEHHIPHLTLSPRTVALIGGKARLLDFGVAALFWLVPGQQPGALNPRYAAPELFEGAITRHADQYSLALIFQEMLTGTHGFRTLNARQMSSARQRGTPDLGLLAMADRVLMLRALHQDPERRFPSCSDFIEALSDVGQALKPKSTVRMLAANGTANSNTPLVAAPTVSPSTQGVHELVALAAKGREMRNRNDYCFLLQPGKSILHHCCARLVPGMVRLKLFSFGDRWKAQLVKRLAEERFLFHIPLTGSLWQRTLGRLPALAVEIRCEFPPNENVTLTEIEIAIRPEACGESQAHMILEKMGTGVLDSVRACLDATPDRRNQVRLPYEQAVQVAPVFDGAPGDAIESQMCDISLRGMNVLMPRRPLSSQVSVRVSIPTRSEPLAILARVTRMRETTDGRFEIGLSFA